MTNVQRRRPTADDSDRGRLPAREELEQWCRDLHDDLYALYDLRVGRSPMYRWARSGLAPITSVRPHEAVLGHDSDPADPTAHGAAMFRTSDVRRAGWLIHDAHKCLARARRLLTVTEQGPPPTAPTGSGWVTGAELEALKEKQRARQKRGEGYGDA